MAFLNYVGFPAYMKPFDGGGWKEVYKFSDKRRFFGINTPKPNNT
jgi:hypothetical protein